MTHALPLRSLMPLAFLLLVACAGPQPETEQESGPPAPEDWQPSESAQERYVALVEQAQSDHEAVDYDKLRDLYVQTRFYQPYAGAEQQFADAMLRALERERHGEALSLAGRILRENYVSLDAHYAARAVYAARDDERRRRRHDYILQALFDSIEASGDGESQASAYEVISTRELQSFISLYGLELVDSEFQADELGAFDRAVVRDPDSGDETAVWFDVSSQWRRGFSGF